MKIVNWMGLLAGCALLQTGNSQVPAPTPVATTAPVPVPAAAQPPATVPASITPAVAEVLRLAESGVTDEVLISYVRNVQTPFNLSADTILYLKDLGVSTPVLTAMLNRDSEIHSYAPAVTAPAPVTQPPPSEAPPSSTYETNPPEDVNYFYSSLNPYGTWVVLDGVGWCWQPRCGVINHSWRPYCDGGYWVYTDCGWYWQSGYSWGWAPFHYGRWCQHERCGWVWCPDRTWAPAWVTWRVGADTCGWAPLPPHSSFVAGVGWNYNGTHVGAGFDFGLSANHFTFVAVKDFNTHEPAHDRLSTVDAHNAFSRTTVVNNTTVLNNSVIVNQGVPVQRVAALTHTEVKKAVIRDVPASSAQGIAMSSSPRSTPVVFRHELPPPTRSPKVVAQKVDAQHPVVQHPTPVPARLPVRTQVATTAPYNPQVNARSQTPWSGQQQLKQSPTVEPPPQGEPVPRYTGPVMPQAQPKAQSPRVESQQQQQGYAPHVYYPKGYQQNVGAVPRSAPSVQGQTGGQVKAF